MKNLIRLLLTATLATCFALPAFALELVSDITISDGNYSNPTGWYSDREDDEVEPGMSPQQKWDLEGFFFDQNILSMIGGYNFRDGAYGSGQTFESGDIFISTGDLESGKDYGDIHRDGGDVFTTGSGYAYNFVLDLSFSVDGGSYTVYEIDDTTVLRTAYYNVNEGSSPWRYIDGGGETVYSGNFSFLTGLSDDATGFSGITHYALTGFDLSFLGADTAFYTHFTMGCGNDNLMGYGTTAPVPEPSTLLLMSAGGGLLWLVRRRKANK